MPGTTQTCPDCGAVFDSPEALAEHARTMHGAPAGRPAPGRDVPRPAGGKPR